MHRLCLALTIQAWYAAGEGDTCAAGGCTAAGAAPRQHHWPVQKGSGERVGFSPHVMPDIAKGPSWSWQETFGDVVRATPLIDDQKNIYITSVAGRSYKFSPKGQLLWSHYTDSMGGVPSVATLWDSVMMLLTRKGFLIALDLDTGVERWAKKVTEQVAQAADCSLVTHGLIIVSVVEPVPLVPTWQVENNRVLALSVEDGSRQASFAPYRPTFNFQASTVHDGSFVFQDRAGGVYRVTTGLKLIWYASAPVRESGTTAAAVIHDGRVFAMSNTGDALSGKESLGLLHVYDYADGQFLWSQDLPYEGNQAVAIGELAGSPGKTSLILGMGKNPQLPIIVRVGFTLPAFLIPFFLPFHLLSLYLPSLFAGKQGRSVTAMDAATGAVLWYHEMEPFQLPAALGDSENVLERFQAMQNGSNPNNEPICLPDANAQPVIDGAGTAFVPFQDGVLYALRDEDGDGHISAGEVKAHFVGSAFQASPGMAPGLLAAPTDLEVKDGCKNMSMPYCLLMVGLMCSLQVIRILYQGLVRQGTLIPDRTVTTHPFFDKSQGVVYNARGFVVLKVMVLAAVLAYYTYSALTAEPQRASGAMWGGGASYGVVAQRPGTYSGGATNYGDVPRPGLLHDRQLPVRLSLPGRGSVLAAETYDSDPACVHMRAKNMRMVTSVAVALEDLRKAIQAYQEARKATGEPSKAIDSSGEASQEQKKQIQQREKLEEELLNLFEKLVPESKGGASKPKNDLRGLLDQLEDDSLFEDETVLCLAMRSTPAVTARVWERTVTATQKLRAEEDEIHTQAVDKAIDTSNATHAMVIFMDKTRHEHYRHLILFDWEAICGAFCYMFVSPLCGTSETLKRICDFLLYLDSEASTKVELDVDTAEEMRQMNAKLQQTAVAMVEYLTDHVQEELWYSDEGINILQDLQYADARLFFARPRLQRILSDMWHPHYDHNAGEYVWYLLKLWTGMVVGLVGLIPCAFCPSLESILFDRMVDEERNIRKEHAESSMHKPDEGTWSAVKRPDAINKQKQKAITHLWLDRYLPILLPRQKKYLLLFSNLSFVVFLVLYNPDHGGTMIILLLSGGALYAETMQLLCSAQDVRRSIRLWLLDRVNIAEFAAFLLISTSCIFRYIHEAEETEPRHVQALWADVLGLRTPGVHDGADDR
ncbi:unnamed protein product [Symbiodinium natans]|uniref:Pyrrolo-quinoline quinone repeat domain-containing protein n=1 Tax=Symbiodinium natans TaxID=878477 RepID=A0A812S1I2_9DINO|nr:unnamed protein product [Symbiodinium natans]